MPPSSFPSDEGLVPVSTKCLGVYEEMFKGQGSHPQYMDVPIVVPEEISLIVRFCVTGPPVLVDLQLYRWSVGRCDIAPRIVEFEELLENDVVELWWQGVYCSREIVHVDSFGCAEAENC